MSKYTTPDSKSTRATRGEIVEEWQTHCGFKEPADPFGSRPFGGEGGMADINRKCDQFFALRNMIWVSCAFGAGDYVNRQ